MNVPGVLIWSRGRSVTRKHLLACTTKNVAFLWYSTKPRPSLTSFGKQQRVHLRTLILKSSGVYLATQLGIREDSVNAFLVSVMHGLGRLSKSIPVKSRSRTRTRSTLGSTLTGKIRTSSGFVYGAYSHELASRSSSRPKTLAKLQRGK